MNEYGTTFLTISYLVVTTKENASRILNVVYVNTDGRQALVHALCNVVWKQTEEMHATSQQQGLVFSVYSVMQLVSRNSPSVII